MPYLQIGADSYKFGLPLGQLGVSLYDAAENTSKLAKSVNQVQLTGRDYHGLSDQDVP